MYVLVFVCTCVCMDGWMVGLTCVCMSTRIYVCMNVCVIYVCAPNPIGSFKVLYLTTVYRN
jgi:hypothetical protein